MGLGRLSGRVQNYPLVIKRNGVSLIRDCDYFERFVYFAKKIRANSPKDSFFETVPVPYPDEINVYQQDLNMNEIFQRKLDIHRLISLSCLLVSNLGSKVQITLSKLAETIDLHDIKACLFTFLDNHFKSQSENTHKTRLDGCLLKSITNFLDLSAAIDAIILYFVDDLYLKQNNASEYNNNYVNDDSMEIDGKSMPETKNIENFSLFSLESIDDSCNLICFDRLQFLGEFLFFIAYIAHNRTIALSNEHFATSFDPKLSCLIELFKSYRIIKWITDQKSKNPWSIYPNLHQNNVNFVRKGSVIHDIAFGLQEASPLRFISINFDIYFIVRRLISFLNYCDKKCKIDNDKVLIIARYLALHKHFDISQRFIMAINPRYRCTDYIIAQSYVSSGKFINAYKYLIKL